MSAIPQGVTHLEVTDNGANFWSITEPDDGTGEVWLGNKWMASEISSTFMQRLVELKQPSSPIKVVVDISGGALHGVYAEVPVSVLFISDDLDDIHAQEEALGESDDTLILDEDRNAVASWLLNSEGGDDAEAVHHYFEQVR